MPDDNTPDNGNKGPLRRFLDMPADSTAKTVTVAVALCLVASMVVSAAAVSLRPVQEVNRLRDKQINVLEVAGVYNPGDNVQEAFAAFEPHVVDLSTGEFTDQWGIEEFDQLATASDPAIVRALDEDPAGLGGQMQAYRMIYLLRDEAGEVDKVILPVEGYGLWSTLYGFIALEENGNDIYGLQFYQHGETPGPWRRGRQPALEGPVERQEAARRRGRSGDLRLEGRAARRTRIPCRCAGRRDADLRRGRQPRTLLDG